MAALLVDSTVQMLLPFKREFAVFFVVGVAQFG
jgi:hypothetical protein